VGLKRAPDDFVPGRGVGDGRQRGEAHTASRYMFLHQRSGRSVTCQPDAARSCPEELEAKRTIEN